MAVRAYYTCENEWDYTELDSCACPRCGENGYLCGCEAAFFTDVTEMGNGYEAEYAPCEINYTGYTPRAYVPAGRDTARLFQKPPQLRNLRGGSEGGDAPQPVALSVLEPLHKAHCDDDTVDLTDPANLDVIAECLGKMVFVWEGETHPPDIARFLFLMRQHLEFFDAMQKLHEANRERLKQLMRAVALHDDL
jgi:hypothetical protein